MARKRWLKCVVPAMSCNKSTVGMSWFAKPMRLNNGEIILIILALAAIFAGLLGWSRTWK